MACTEVFGIERGNDYDILYCKDRTLWMTVSDGLDIPTVPDTAAVVFARVTIPPALQGEGIGELFLYFSLCPFKAISYEPYFNHYLITEAIKWYVSQEMNVWPSELLYSSKYQREFIDIRDSKDIMTPELNAYLKRDDSEELLDFFAWKKKHLAAVLN